MNTKKIGVLCGGLAVVALVWSMSGLEAKTLRDLDTELLALAEEVEKHPTNTDNAEVRAQLIWLLANRLAREGRTSTVDLPAVVYLALTMEPGAPLPATYVFDQLDRYVKQLLVAISEPEALGTVTWTAATDPLIAGEWGTVEIGWTVGSQGFDSGDGLLVAGHHLSDASAWVVNDPAAEGALRVEVTRDGDAVLADAVWETAPMMGTHGAFRSVANHPAWRLVSGRLEPGDLVTIIVGDMAGGGPGFRVPTSSTDGWPVPVYVDLDGTTTWHPLPIPVFEVQGAAIVGAHGFAPSVVTPGEPFDLTVRAEDRWRNLATGDIPGWRVLLDGEPWLEEARPQSNHAFTDVTIEELGIHRITIESETGVIGTVNPIVVADDPDLRIFWGETHGHSGFAEGMGSAAGFFRFGRDEARLDFLTLSEHDIWMDDAEWQLLLDTSAEFHEDGRFVVFPGYEWTGRRELGGHHNVLFRNGEHRRRIPVHQAQGLTELYRALYLDNSPQDLLVIPHAHQAGDWRTNDPGMERLVEIHSMHGTFEWFGWRYLQAGHQVGFIAASDDHVGHPGYTSAMGGSSPLRQPGGLTAVWAAERTGDALFDALRDGRTYATTGPRILLSAQVNGHDPGSRQPMTEDRVFDVVVDGTAPIDEVAILRDGVVVYREGPEPIARPRGKVSLELGFSAPSDAIGRDNPRGHRPFIGRILVDKAIVLSALGGDNPRDERVERVSETEVQFALYTRGRREAITLELDGVGPKTVVQVELEEVVEGPAPPGVRKHATLPATQVTLSAGGQVDLESSDHTDRIDLVAPDPTAPWSRTVTWEDVGRGAPNEAYVVRVTQRDGHMAWSSPFWIGGEARR